MYARESTTISALAPALNESVRLEPRSTDEPIHQHCYENKKQGKISLSFAEKCYKIKRIIEDIKS